VTTPTTVQVRLQIRADTAANWTSVNPVLLANELGLESDTKKFKIGNGTNNWSGLAYFPSIVSGGTVLGNLEIGTTGTLTFEGSTADGFETTLGVVNPTADRTILLPNQSGTVVVGGNASITNADIAANAEIAVSKLADGAARQLLQTDAAGTGVEWTDNVDIPGTLDVTGSATFDSSVTITGDLTVNGTTTNINTQNLVVEDKNVILGDVATPTDITADGGGITLKGTTDKTINWIDATDAWTLSEHVNIASAKEYRIAGTKVLDATSLGTAVVSSSLTSVGTIGTGTWQGSTIATGYGGTGQTTYSNGQLLIGKTDGTLAKATITQGTGVTITNGDGSITISATGSGGTVTGVTGTAPITSSGGTAPDIALSLKTNGGLVTETGTLAVDLGASSITGTLGVADGGTGQTTYTDGQLLIGNSTGNTLSKSTLTAGTGITITNGSGSISVAGTAASTSTAGVVQLTDSTSSTSTTTAATPNAVKSAYDLANAALPKAGGALTGDVTLNAQSDLRFADADSSNWVAFQGPATVASNVTWTLPSADGTSGQVLSTNGSGTLSWATASGGGGSSITQGNTTAEVIDTGSDGRFVVTTEGTERARVDSSGRLLVGTSTARSNLFNSTFSTLAQLEGAGTGSTLSSFALISNANNNGYQPFVVFAKSRGTVVGSNTIVSSGDTIGTLTFQGSDGSEFVEAALISAEVDGTPGANDMPGRLVFSTTADGAASATERARITSGGYFKASDTGSYYSLGGAFHEYNQSTVSGDNTRYYSSNASYSGQILIATAFRVANSAYRFLSCQSDAGGDLEFNLRGDGQAYADGSWNGGGADYAEYFEWEDGNPDAEDRRGYPVALVGNKIKIAENGDTIIGIVSAAPVVLGDAAWNHWSGKYLKDEFGGYLLDENGDRQLNPDYDPTQPYVPREDRPEWSPIGLMGKLRLRKGQPVAANWLKLRDINDSVEEWLVR
jgi:hypothetical protein